MSKCPTFAELKEWLKGTEDDMKTEIGLHLNDGCLACEAELKSHLLSSWKVPREQA